MAEPMQIPSDCLVVVDQMGICKVCGAYQDLRLGSCFDCSDFVDGKPDGKGGHVLWDVRHPEKTWYVRVM